MATQTTGKNPGYETMIITRPSLSDEAVKALQDKLIGVIAAYKGEVVVNEDLGSKKLAYPIQKEARGRYTYMVYSGEGEIVHEIERNLRLQDTVLRFLTVNLDKEFDPEAWTKRRAELVAASKKREEEREARRMERMGEERGGYRDRGDRYGGGDRAPRGGFGGDDASGDSMSGSADSE